MSRTINQQRFRAEIAGFIIGAIVVWALAWSFYSWDREFLDNATITQAVVTDKDVGNPGSTSVPSRNYSVSYRWVVEGGHEYKGKAIDESWSGTSAWSGGEERWDALEPGVSAVEIAWRYSDDRRSTESRLLEHGVVGIPWPMIILGAVMFGIATGRLVWRARQRG
jgi:hypothetical protein